MKNRKSHNVDLVNVIYDAIYQILTDYTGNPSYRKYFDKVIKDIYDMDEVITSFLMSTNQTKYLQTMIVDPDMKPFCQMLLRDEDIKAVKDLVRVAYDAAQIANKSKKRLSSKDIKSYRYLIKLYSQGIKSLRKKYTENTNNKKSYKSKYSNLDSMLGRKSKNHLSYDFDDYDYFMDDDDEDDDDDDIFGSLFIDNVDTDNDIYEDTLDYDLKSIPPKFLVNNKNRLILDTDDDDDANMRPTMSQDEFQKYTLSILDKLLDKIEERDNSVSKPVYDFKLSPEAMVPIQGYTEDITDHVIDEESESESEVANHIDNTSNAEDKTVIIDEAEVVPKSYEEMTREECINEFNSVASETIPDKNSSDKE